MRNLEDPSVQLVFFLQVPLVFVYLMDMVTLEGGKILHGNTDLLCIHKTLSIMS